MLSCPKIKCPTCIPGSVRVSKLCISSKNIWISFDNDFFGDYHELVLILFFKVSPSQSYSTMESSFNTNLFGKVKATPVKDSHRT